MSIFGSLAKAVVGAVIETPVALVADVVTMGGSINDRDEPYTATAVRKIVGNIESATEGDE